MGHSPVASLHNRRFISQARQTRNFARSARLGEKNFFLLPSSRASRKMQRSRRLVHKAPVMQATLWQVIAISGYAHKITQASHIAPLPWGSTRVLAEHFLGRVTKLL